jgi:hypothetical protein
MFMSKRIGSIYRVKVDNEKVRYFWDVGTDQTQLGSAIIAVFRRSYPSSAVPNFVEITSDEPDFYCHTVVLVGRKLRFWSKIGFLRVSRFFPMLFRDSHDYGNPAIRVSERWVVWEPNQPMRDVGKLVGDYTKAEIGVVINPKSVVNRILTGRYDMFYPAYKPSMDPCA